MRRLILFLMIIFMQACYKHDSLRYIPCQIQENSPVEARYISSDGTELIMRFSRESRLYSATIELMANGDDALLISSPRYFSDDRGFFVEGEFYIPYNFQSLSSWNRRGLSCKIISNLGLDRYNIYCYNNRSELSNIYFVFSPSRGIELIGFAPIISGSERGEEYFRLSSRQGAGAQCVSL